MNLNINLGKQNNGDDFSLDFAKQNLNLILLLGATGTGKSVFHFQLYKELIKQNTPEELGFILIENTQVDFPYFPKSHLIKRTLNVNQGIKDFDEILKELKGRISGNKSKEKALFVHIEECDQFAQNYDKTVEFYKEFIRLKQDSNVYVVYSTSRPSVEVLPDWLIESADMKAVFGLASEVDCQRVLGNSLPLAFKSGERIIVIKNKFITCQPFSNEELKQIQDFENGK